MTTAISAFPGLDLLATAVMLVDESGTVRYMNPAAENLFGLSSRNAEGMHLDALFDGSSVLTTAIGYARDNDRRRILEQELNSEQKLLDQAKKELGEQEAVRLGSERNYQRVLDRLEPFQKRVRLHEDNIANLRKELSKIR